MNIKSIERKGNNDFFSLAITFLRRFYRAYIKKSNKMRCLVMAVNRVLMFLLKYVSAFLQGYKKYDYSTLKDVDFIAVTNIQVEERSLINAGLVYYQGKIEKGEGWYPTSFNIPSVRICELADASVESMTNVVFFDDEIVFHDLFDVDRDLTSEQLHLRMIYKERTKTLLWKRIPVVDVVMQEGAVFTDACSQNYAHWLTEILPRVSVFCEYPEYENVPILIDSGLHPNLLRALELVVGDRVVHALDKRIKVKVNKLYVVSVTGYVPFDVSFTSSGCAPHGQYSSYALNNMVRKIVNTTDNSIEEGGKKLYLKRKGVRSIVNEEEVERLLVADGFSVIDTSKMTFDEQVALFSGATHVVSPTGAALANTIFCKRDCKIGVILGKHKKMIYGYWPAVLAFKSLRVDCVIGKPQMSVEDSIHSDFVVNCDDVTNLLCSWVDAANDGDKLRGIR